MYRQSVSVVGWVSTSDSVDVSAISMLHRSMRSTHAIRNTPDCLGSIVEVLLYRVSGGYGCLYVFHYHHHHHHHRENF